MHAYIYIYVCMYVCMYVCVSVCVYMYMYMYIQIPIEKGGKLYLCLYSPVHTPDESNYGAVCSTRG